MDATVLVVEHDDVNREVVEVSLRSAGWRVLTAATGLEALQHVEAGPPDAIISETHMPGLDGFELIRRLRQRADWAAIPFIIVTEHRSAEDRMRGLELGVEDYLTKPVFMQELVTRVRIALSRAQRARIESDGAARTRFTGRLSDMSVADLVQTVDVSRKSGVIHLERNDRVRGEIYFREGKLVDAESGRHSGERALFRLLLWGDGNFTIEFKTIHRRDAMLRGNQAALLEGMRRQDEWNRVLEGMPSPHLAIEVVFERLAERLGDVPDSANSFLRVLDGRRTIEQAVEDCELDDVEALRAAKMLYENGMVRVVATRPGPDRGPTPPPTPVAPRVAALTTRRPTFDAPRVSLHAQGGGEAPAAFSTPTAPPMGATTVMGHAILTPLPQEKPERSESPAIQTPAPVSAPRVTMARSSARPATPPANPPQGTAQVGSPARPATPPVSAPAVTTERSTPRPTAPPASAPRVTMERSAARPSTPAVGTSETPPGRPPTEPPRAAGASFGRVRRMTPVAAPVIPFPTPATHPAASPLPNPAEPPTFGRALSRTGPDMRSADRAAHEGEAEADFFSVSGVRSETEPALSEPDLSVFHSGAGTTGKKVFVAMAVVVGVVAIAVAVTRGFDDPGGKAAPRAKHGVVPAASKEPLPTRDHGTPAAPTAPAPHAAPAPPPAPPAGPSTPAAATPPASVATPGPEPATPPTPAPGAPSDGEYTALLAEAHNAYARGRGREVARLASAALVVRPTGDEAMALLGAIALDAGKNRVALEWADKALAVNADNARAHAVKGAILYEKGSAAEAKKHFERYLDLDPQGALAEDVRQTLREM